MNKEISTKAVLTLAGFDGTGGAGISTDIKICSHFQVPNISVVTCLVIQNPHEVSRLIPMDVDSVQQQVLVLLDHFDVSVVNIGLLGDITLLDAILPLINKNRIILDPIIYSGSGNFRFLGDKQIDQLKKYLKYIYLITPNIPEANLLCGSDIQNFKDIQKAAQILMDLGAENVLIKGGHLKGINVNDTLFERDGFTRFSGKRKPFRIHGTGSFLNAAIAAHVYLGKTLKSSVRKAKGLLNKEVGKVRKGYPLLSLHE